MRATYLENDETVVRPIFREAKELGLEAHGYERDRILREAARLMEDQYMDQFRRWRFYDVHCARVMGEEQERREREALERDALAELARAERRVKEFQPESV